MLSQLDNDFAPCISCPESRQCARDLLEPLVRLICVGDPLQLAGSDQVEDTLPDVFDRVLLLSVVHAPMQTHDTDVLQENSVQGNFFDVSAGESNHQ